MNLDQIEALLKHWGRRRRMDSDVSAVIFGANGTGFSRVNQLEKMRRDALQKGRRDEQDAVPTPAEDDPDIIAIERAFRRLESLAPLQAQVADLWYVQQLGVRDIAAQLSINRGRVHGARMSLPMYFAGAIGATYEGSG